MDKLILIENTTGKEYTYKGSTGRVWREPPEGSKFEIGEDGIEYDITEYIEDEGVFVISPDGIDRLDYLSNYTLKKDE